MTTHEGFLNQRQRYQSIKLPQDFSDPDREATYSEYRKNILNYLGFSKYDDEAQARLEKWTVIDTIQLLNDGKPRLCRGYFNSDD